jgi:hypothetical protein
MAYILTTWEAQIEGIGSSGKKVSTNKPGVLVHTCSLA